MPLVSTTTRGLRAGRKFIHGLMQTEHPLLVHIIPIRRCNIDCGYCNEYDKVSPPVPFDTMMARIDKLAELGTAVVAFSGGEPLLHPQLDDLIRRIRSHGMMAGLITNGFLLSPDRIKALNDSGLDYMQISIDNVVPDEVSKKSLKTLDAPDKEGRVHSKLKLLREHASFQVNINSVLGGGTKNPEDARTINTRARELGFTTSIGIIHDGLGQLKPLGTGRARDLRRRFTPHRRRRPCRQEHLLRHPRLPVEPGGREAERLALPRRRALPVHLRERPRALLLAAARHPGDPAREVHHRAHPPRVQRPEVLRPVLHDRLRPPRVDHGFLAQASDGGVLGIDSRARRQRATPEQTPSAALARTATVAARAGSGVLTDSVVCRSTLAPRRRGYGRGPRTTPSRSTPKSIARQPR